MIRNRKQEKYDLCTRYLSELSEATSLLQLLNIHRNLWNDGLRHPNIDPDEYGIFRIRDISFMTPSEVYLGNIHGLWTAPLSEWIGTMDEHIIIEQYRNHLISNVDMLRSLVFDNGIDRGKVERTIAADAPVWAKVTVVRITDDRMREDKLMEFTYLADGKPGRSNVLLISVSPKTDMLLVPQNWHRGEHVGSIFRVDRIGRWKDLGYKGRVVSLRKELFGRGVTIRNAEDAKSKTDKQSRLKR